MERERERGEGRGGEGELPLLFCFSILSFVICKLLFTAVCITVISYLYAHCKRLFGTNK